MPNNTKATATKIMLRMTVFIDKISFCTANIGNVDK